MNTSYLCTNKQLSYVLKSFRAERDSNGRFKISGELPFSFMGTQNEDTEILVGPKCKCLINGREVGVVYLLNQTSYGLKVNLV